jgi:RNA polymerase sigma factor (sigma-70 family)
MANIGLAHMIIGQMLRPGYKFEDLLQEGTMGLIRASESFQPDRNIRFSTYAAFWIRSKIQRFIENHHKEANPTVTPNAGSPRAQKVSLDRSVGANGEEFSLEEIIPSDIQNPEEIVLRSERANAVRDVLSRIVLELKNPHLQAIIERRILADEPESLENLGKELHISRESCRLLENKMLRLAKQELGSWRN